MKLILFFFLYLLHRSLGETEKIQRNYVVEEEDANRISYLLVEAEDGRYEIENLTDYSIQVTASAADVSYYFHSQLNQNGTLVDSVSNIPADTFDPEKEVLILIHGWINDHTSTFNTYAKSAALEKFDLNVIVVDWSKYAINLYLVARNTVPEIGKYVGEFVQSLTSAYDIPLSKVSFVGHSLGAHISGIAGKSLGGKVKNIVGLDPAGPLVSVSDKDYCLDASDAEYVQVIHTSGGFLGLSTSLGHSDYYPNGGKNQPGCGWDIAGSCSHGRAYKYYAESITKNDFVSEECSSYADFTQGKCNGVFSFMGGYDLDEQVSGDYYLNTNENYPYAITSN